MIEVETPLFKSLPEEALERIRAVAQTRRFAPGEAMMQEGESRGELFVLVAGEALVVGKDWHGEPKALARIGPGECFGEISMLSGEPASATVEAATETEAWVLPHADVVAISEAYPELGRNLSALLAERLRLSNERQLRAQRGELAALYAAGAPDWAFWLAYRLAASVAKQTRQAVAFVDLSGRALESPLPQAVETLAKGVGRKRDGTPSPQLEVYCNGDDDDVSERRLLGSIERLQEGSRQVIVYFDSQTAIGQPVCTRADKALALAREAQLGTAAFLGQPVQNGRAPGAIVLRERPEMPSAGDVGRAQAVLGTRASVWGVVADGAASPGEPASDSAAGRSIDRVARKIAGISIGLALGGGGAKGYAHIGVIRVLEQARVPFDCVTGCSIGAPLAAGVAAGWSVEEIRAQVDAISQKAFRLNVPIVSILTSRAIRAELEAVVAGTRFEELPTLLGIVAVDIERGEEVLMRKGLIWPALLASMAYPGVYEPVRIGSRYLVDGGVLSPVPVSAAVTLGADIIISSNLSASPLKPKPLAANSGIGRRRLILENITRCLEIMQRKIVQESCNRADISIDPLFEDPPGLLDFKRGRLLEQAGADAAERALPKLREALPWLDGAEVDR